MYEVSGPYVNISPRENVKILCTPIVFTFALYALCHRKPLRFCQHPMIGTWYCYCNQIIGWPR